MKTKKWGLALLAAISLNAYGQSTQWGIKGGINLANISGDYKSYATEDNMRIGFYFGGLMEINFSEKWAIQPELLVSTQGNNYTVEEPYFDGSWEVEKIEQTNKLTYINLPILVKCKPIPALAIEFGPQLGYMLAGKAVLQYTDSGYPQFNETVEVDLLKADRYYVGGESVYFDPNTNRFEVGLVLGASYQINNNLFLQGRYQLGLTPIEDTEFSEDETRNSVFQIGLGYKF